MSVAALLLDAEAAGVVLTIGPTGLDYEAPETPEADRLLAEIAAHKAEVIAAITAPPWPPDDLADRLIALGMTPDQAHDASERVAIETEGLIPHGCNPVRVRLDVPDVQTVAPDLSGPPHTWPAELSKLHANASAARLAALGIISAGISTDKQRREAEARRGGTYHHDDEQRTREDMTAAAVRVGRDVADMMRKANS
ncbi:hypothetical protein [Methylibium sp.]|uniref:hypothetical protein n=1 Tax=Methylibium sp. TaxID=2067992 RepID=UPI0017952719|nr:hypothetical protein [Methylibium sp.]MBA3588498.1 hypothetical protein [Methylibium sp.]